VLGVDVAETALAIAREKAESRGIEIEFVAADAFQLERLGRRFKTVLDGGLFHTFDGDERPWYVASLASVTEHDGTLYVLCFSDEGSDIGPHPVSQEELRTAFNPGAGWNVASIEPDRVQTRFHDHGAPAWLATIKRIEFGPTSRNAMKRIWTIVGVRNVPASFKWCQSLFGQPETPPSHDHFGQILDTDGTVLICLHQWGAHEHPSLMSPDETPPGNGLLLFFRVDDFDLALKSARALVTRLEEEPHVNTNTQTREFSLRDPDGYYVTISEVSARRPA
jgi:hypothetical protein